MELILQARSDLDDAIGEESERLWSTADLINYINDGQKRMCRRVRRLISDSSTIDEVLAAGTITIAGASGSVNSIKVNGIEIMSGAVSYNTSITQTAADVASDINAFTSVPNYTATSALGVITISAVAGTGSNPNRYTVSATCATLTATTVAMSGGTAVTRLYLLPDQTEYDLDDRILEVVRIKLSTSTYPLVLKTTDEMDETYLGWEDWEAGTPRYFIMDSTSNRIRIAPPSDAAATAFLRVLREPLSDITAAILDQDLEIPDRYIAILKEYALHRAYLKQDTETLRPERSEIHLKLFERDIEQIRGEITIRTSSGQTAKPMGAFL